MTKSVFVIMKHKAKKAGLHYDLRFRMSDSTMWASFAVPKGVPTKPGKKVLAIRTKDHTKKGALITGRIKEGYGTGTLEVWDIGRCDIIKYSDKHILLDLYGRKVKGKYHLISTIRAGDKDKTSFFLFKGKLLNEGTGMISRIPSGGIASDVEEGEDELTSPDLPWDKTPRTVGQ
jgi:bifunctional non-homologous end joining protein LigD